MSRALLVVGQSHVAALRDAARQLREEDPAAPRTRVIHTREPQFAPELVPTPGGPRFTPPLAAAIREGVAAHGARLVSAIGGNVHTVLGLMRHPQPFDFALPGTPPPDADAWPLTTGLVAATLRAHMAADLDRLRALAALDLPFVQVESPPPLADAATIQAAADQYFQDNGIAARGVAPAGLRHRLWLLANRIARAEADRLGGGWCAVPAAAQAPAGFLRPDLAGDATHGNARYGRLMIAALAA